MEPRSLALASPDAVRADRATPSTVEIGHAVQFYENEAFLAAAVADFLADGLAKGQRVIVVATEENRRAFATRLKAKHVDVEAARRHGDLTLLDARETLSMFMISGRPDRERFHDVIGAVLNRVRQSDRMVGLRIYGEMVDVLWRDGHTDAAIRLEGLWNELGETVPFSLLCGYKMGNFYKSADAARFAEVCRNHTHVIPTERYVEGDTQLRALEVARLQQRERALQTELDHRVELERRLREALTAAQRAEEAVRASERDVKDFLENASEGMHWVGPDGRILWANQAELDLLGYSANEYVGRHIAEFHADPDAIADILSRLARNESLCEYEARLLCKDGRIRHVLISSNVLRRDGQFIHTRCFTRDITALKHAGAERERLLASERAARAEADAANRAKSEFLASMSHELRTPLNSIGGYVQLVLMGVHGPVTETQRAVLQRVERSQRHLLGLINDILNLSRIEAGKLEYKSERVAVAPLLQDACDMVAPLVSSKKLTCAIELCDALKEVAVRADRDKVQQILLNLLSNAIKFTPALGRIVVSASACSDDARLLCLHVRDSGIGIPPSKLTTVFEPFVQVGASSGPGTQGTGLGLAISRDLALGMHGDLSVTSEIGKGATFTLRLPRD